MPTNAIRRATLAGEFEPGQELDGRYRIIERLGSGGMGAVYEAEQIKLHKRVAIKIMHPERAIRDTGSKRFLREAQVASAIEHGNVVDIIDYGELPDGTTYLVMELLKGRDLSSFLREHGPLDWARARGILLQVLRGLKAAHDAGIIHRDIKPANMFLLEPDDEYQLDDRVKVLDFGIARFEQTEGETQELTDTSELLGTVAYMAPELARRGRASVRSDLYAVGILAYKMMTGETPFRAATGVQVLFCHIYEEPPAPRSVVPSIPEAVEAAILRTLAKHPDDRFQTAEELGRALASIEDDGTVASKGIYEALFASSSRTTLPRSSELSLPLPRSRSTMALEAVAPASRGALFQGVLIGGFLALLVGVAAWGWLRQPDPVEAVGAAEPRVEVAATVDAAEQPGAMVEPVTSASEAARVNEAARGSSEATGEAGAGTTSFGHLSRTDAEVPEEQEQEQTRSSRRTTQAQRTAAKQHRPSPPAKPEVIPETISNADQASAKAAAQKVARNCGRSHSSLMPDVTIEVSVEPNGTVSASVLPPMKGTPVGTCVASAVLKLHFAKSQRGLRTTWRLPLS